MFIAKNDIIGNESKKLGPGYAKPIFVRCESIVKNDVSVFLHRYVSGLWSGGGWL